MKSAIQHNEKLPATTSKDDLAHMKASVGGEALSMIQATSVAVVGTDEQVVSIYANARYDKPEDLKWTSDICRAVVAALTGKP